MCYGEAIIFIISVLINLTVLPNTGKNMGQHNMIMNPMSCIDENNQENNIQIFWCGDYLE